MNSLFVKGIKLKRDAVKNFNVYPFNIPIIKNLNEVIFNKNVTFFFG